MQPLITYMISIQREYIETTPIPKPEILEKQSKKGVVVGVEK
jgi:hypothetical protein